jgi:hypothetical protein
MAGEIFRSSVALNLKNTLDYICTDELDGVESNLDYKKFMKERPMYDAYADDQEYAGGGLLAETPEGGEIAPLTLHEGYTQRYTARKFAGKYVVTEEAIADSKYGKVIQAVKRLKRSAWKTADIDAINLLVRAVNAAFPGSRWGCIGICHSPVGRWWYFQ